ncbi:MAG: Nif11-like leader peptide family natural product precursor [Coriobacteriia bacterium]|nr:Nif11-like leader peptide family natural product precursor [Coriobacteriia bacterium]
MKDVKQFIEDLQKDPELAKALEVQSAQAEEKVKQAEDPEAARLEFLAEFAKEYGYDLDPEELALATAKNREVDDAFLADVAGGGNSSEQFCFWIYACEMVLNTCEYSNNCLKGERCTRAAGWS